MTGAAGVTPPTQLEGPKAAAAGVTGAKVTATGMRRPASTASLRAIRDGGLVGRFLIGAAWPATGFSLGGRFINCNDVPIRCNPLSAKTKRPRRRDAWLE